jgi:predicted ester cyclase
MTEAERNLGKRWFDEVWNQGRRDAIPAMFPPHGILHDGRHSTLGPDAFYLFFDRMTAAFSDLKITVEDTFAEGDKLCLRWSCTAKHTGTGMSFPPTHKDIHVTGISIMRVAGGQIVEAWQNWDMLGMLEQIQNQGQPPTYIAAPARA